MNPTAPLHVRADLTPPFSGGGGVATLSERFAPYDLGARDGGRHLATEMTLQLFAREPRLRALLASGLTPSLQAPRVACFDPGARFDRAQCDLRLNRPGPGPLLAQIGFYRDGRLIASASQRGALLPTLRGRERSVS